MTAFHIALILLLIFIIIFGIVCYKDGIPCDIEDWFGSIMISVILELLIIMIAILLGIIFYFLFERIDWYGFFHDKII